MNIVSVMAKAFPIKSSLAMHVVSYKLVRKRGRGAGAAYLFKYTTKIDVTTLMYGIGRNLSSDAGARKHREEATGIILAVLTHNRYAAK